MNVGDKPEYSSTPSTKPQLDEVTDLMRTLVNLQAELLEAFSLVESPRIKKEERREKPRTPSIFTAILTPFSEARAREFYQKLSITPVRILVWKVFLAGSLISVISSLIAREGYGFEFGLAVTALGEGIANFFFPQMIFQDFTFLRCVLGLLLGTTLFIAQSFAIGMLTGSLMSKPDLSGATKGSKIVLTADFTHLFFLSLFGIPVLQFHPYLLRLSPLVPSIVMLFAVIPPLVLKFIKLWRGLEIMYGETDPGATVSMLLLFFLNLIYYALILS